MAHGGLRFQYDWFVQDLARVRHGITEYLAEPDTAPREVAPLRGDYRN